jgi:hypothetical protein
MRQHGTTRPAGRLARTPPPQLRRQQRGAAGVGRARGRQKRFRRDTEDNYANQYKKLTLFLADKCSIKNSWRINATKTTAKRDSLVGKPNYFGAQTTSGHNLLKVLTMRFLALIKMTPKRNISLGSAAFLLGRLPT